ncbi:hypothetical protein EXU85_30185 [Spirosoma sp. KCTC 42546]|uniref:ORC-CDC6 family AAA ATPase n=1 Tax=Spirosoma sp. KCTC 42546 TaxID=2520506 RepID=UPI0011587BB5|nr:hypothetical protein [Spirosoma sp. KCTC 42546]QDK82649.1 hypothetical protein EXU85_30185 [Spirosoma sp. KCTC 42546]
MITEINPFFTRASEYIELDDKFLNLFSPEILSIFKNESNIWRNVNIFRSAPGGGKTTLLRMFTPKVLKKLKETSRHDDHNREIFNELKNLQVYDIDGSIQIVGSIVQFNNEYVSIQFLNINEYQKIKVFVALVNVRIIISILQAIFSLKEFKSSDEFSRITFDFSNSQLLPTGLRNITSGLNIYNWACDLEESICNKIDSVYTDTVLSIEGGDSFYSLDIFNSDNILIDNQRMNEKILVMLDDVHNLSSFQRNHLINSIIARRPRVNTWVSERLKALTMDELFSEGNTEGRDMTTIHLEKFWSKKYVAFEKFVKSVANRRVAAVLDVPREFASYLREDFTEDDTRKIKAAIPIVKERVIKNYGSTKKYEAWISDVKLKDDDFFAELVNWRSLEILCFRDNNKSQKMLNFGEDFLEVEKLKDQQGSDVNTAAQLFLNKEFDIPFYFGISKISKLSSFNIEQFLSLSGELFEDIRYNDIKRIVNPNHSLEISSSRQEKILKNLINNKKWKELTNKVPNFSKIEIFLNAIGSFCQQETYTPNAWNSPGLNAVAILMRDRDILKGEALMDKSNIYHNLAKCISDCISYNLIDFELNYKNKDKTLMILYLNKMYCSKYNLPLNRGKFKEKRLNELLNWYNNGFKISAQKRIVL